MTESEVFLTALDQPDEAARSAYLDHVCAGNPVLRRRIEELLKWHRPDDKFLEISAVKQLSNDDRILHLLAPPREKDAIGWLDHYHVLEIIGRGATGLVLKARDSKLERIVAIKVLAPRLAASESARRRFVREAQAVAAVRDDHVVGIHDVNDEGSLPYLVMEFIAGKTLAGRLKESAPVAVDEILRIGLQIAKGLAAAHAQGLVHCDIKPGNILLENGVQRVKITDFGLARSMAEAGAAEFGIIAGTPQFMSPCQARGEPAGPRSDLFSLGAVFYTLCTGRPPFSGETTAAVLKSVCEDTPVPISEVRSDVPEWLCALIDKLLAKEAGQRFASAQELADVLTGQLARLQQAVTGQLPTSPETPSSPVDKTTTNPPAGPSTGRTWLLAAFTLIGALGTLVVFAASQGTWRGREGTTADGKAKAARGMPPRIPLELRREDIPPMLLALAGGGDPAQAPPELVSVLGDGRLLLPWVGQTAWMDQSPDGKLLAMPLDEDVVLFDVPTGRYLRTLKGPGGRAFSLAFSGDGQLLAVTTRREEVGGAVRVWDLPGERALYTNQQSGPTISCAVCFSADGKRLFTEVDGRIHVCDSRTGELLQKVELPPGGIASLAFSPDGRQLAVANWKANVVKLFTWDTESLKEAYTLPHPWPVASALFSPDGRFLATADLTRLMVWNAETREKLLEVETEGQQLAFAPDSRTLYATTTTEVPRSSHVFRRWDVVKRKQLSSLSVEISAAPARAFHRLSRDGKVLYVVGQHGATYIRAIDTANGKELFPRRGHVAPLNIVTVSPDGRIVASAGEDWTVKLWDLASGEVRHSLSAHTSAVSGLAFGPNGKLLASGSRDGTIALWDVETGNERRALHGHSRSFSRIAFSPDGQTLAAGAENGSVKLWDVATGKQRSPLPGHVSAVRCVVFNGGGTSLASGGKDGTVLLHNLSKGATQTFRTPHPVNHLAFSPDGHTLACIGDGPDAALHLWDIATSQETIAQGHRGNVYGLAFSPTHPLLATAGADGTVRLWDLAGTLTLRRTIGPGPFGGPVRSVAFTSDGRYLITANANGTVYVLRIGES